MLLGNNVTKPVIGRSKTSQMFKSYAYSNSLKQIFLSQGKSRRIKVKEDKIFLKLYWDKGKSNFISLEDYFALLLKLYICDFYIYLPVFEIKRIF